MSYAIILTWPSKAPLYAVMQSDCRANLAISAACEFDAQVTLRVAHDDLEQCVGLATAAFALECARP
eukprot:4755301-Pleurochrysis_carterae.AAC.1